MRGAGAGGVIATGLVLSALLATHAVAAGSPDASTPCALPGGWPQAPLLLLGEMHGSVEAPALVLQVACAQSRTTPVVVGLEVPVGEQSRLQAYLDSAGADADVQALTDTAFWRSGHDGRSSAAMLALVEGVRALRGQGHRVELVAFDAQPGSGQDRDPALADGLRRLRAAYPQASVLALMGNVHAARAPLQLGDTRLVPTGALLADLQPVSVLLAYPAGTTWACTPECGVQRLDAAPGSGQPGLASGARMEGYDYTYVLPSLTASPPARMRDTTHGPSERD